MGSYAGKCRCHGTYNIAFGKEAFRGSSTYANNTGSDNIAIGQEAGANVSTGNLSLIHI